MFNNDHDCRKEELIDDIRKDMREIKADIKQLIKDTTVFKVKSGIIWGVLGGVLTVAVHIGYEILKAYDILKQ